MTGIRSKSRTDAAPLSSERWSEDLIWQAKRGLELGRAHCNCAGSYHLLWGVLRASAVLGGLRIEESGPASDVLSPLIRDGTRVLIGGSADPATFCDIGRLAGARRPVVTVIDKCKAPLQLIEEFAAKRGERCETLHGDIADLDRTAAWDLIVLHYTPSFVDPDLRQRFFTRLALSLAPDGTLVCATKSGRKTPSEGPKKLESLWFDQARKTILASRFASYLDETENERMLHRFAAEAIVRRVNEVGRSEIKAFLCTAGLAVIGETATGKTPSLDDKFDIKAKVESSVIISASRPRV